MSHEATRSTSTGANTGLEFGAALAAPQGIFFGGLCGGSLDWLKLLLPVFLGEGSLYKI